MGYESHAFATDAKAWLLHSLSPFDISLLRMTDFNLIPDHRKYQNRIKIEHDRSKAFINIKDISPSIL
jgi:hypothetical protein